MSSPFDKLPAELYDKVFEYIALPYWEIPDRKPTRPGSDDVHSFDHVINVHRGPFGHYIHTRPRPGDLQLRLVNHACNCAMLRVYFKYEGLSFNAGRWHALERFKEHILRNDGKAWSIASAVEKLNVSLSTGEYAVGSIFYKEHSKSRRWKKQLNENEKFDEDAERLKSFLDAGVLAQAVRKMPKLESLIVHLPEEWRDGYPSDYDEVDDEGNTCGEQLRLDLLRSVREAVAAIFEPQAALTASPTIDSGTGHLACLTYLRLTLPCAYDFARVASCMPDTVASRLRHLYMEIVDDDPDSEDDEDHPSSNLQREYPNTTHMRDMCELVNRCKNLESLGLVGTQCIDLEGLQWWPTSGGLKNIYLSRVVGTADKLLTLLSSKNGACNIEAFEIEDVQLVDGTWESVFARLLTSPSLLHFHVYNLVYNRYGKSAHLRLYNGRPWENVSVIWTENHGDVARLRDVVGVVKAHGYSVNDEMDEFLDSQDEGHDGNEDYTVEPIH